jgi:4-hydroxythreonine-4-phosphate dehydrogenase
MGDPSGIGPLIIARALPQVRPLARFVIIGERRVFNRLPAAGCRFPDTEFIDLNNVSHKNFSFGKIKAEYGRASIEYLDKAMELIRKREIDCLVTGPISKEAVNLAGFRYSGHTEYFAKRLKAKNTVMMLLNRRLKFSLVTRHIPLKAVSGAINKEVLEKTIVITYRALKDLFSIRNPRIVVAGLNPHASDNGVIGKEENLLIKPVLKRLKNKIPGLIGPLSSDIAIAGMAKKKYDCVIAMYHDQALISLKLIDRRSGVNLTLGLPFIRTSPLHGTAFDIAAKDKLADPASLIAAIRLAVRCATNQRKA